MRYENLQSWRCTGVKWRIRCCGIVGGEVGRADAISASLKCMVLRVFVCYTCVHRYPDLEETSFVSQEVPGSPQQCSEMNPSLQVQRYSIPLSSKYLPPPLPRLLTSSLPASPLPTAAIKPKQINGGGTTGSKPKARTSCGDGSAQLHFTSPYGAPQSFGPVHMDPHKVSLFLHGGALTICVASCGLLGMGPSRSTGHLDSQNCLPSAPQEPAAGFEPL